MENFPKHAISFAVTCTAIATGTALTVLLSPMTVADTLSWTFVGYFLAICVVLHLASPYTFRYMVMPFMNARPPQQIATMCIVLALFILSLSVTRDSGISWPSSWSFLFSFLLTVFGIKIFWLDYKAEIKKNAEGAE